MVVKSRNKTLAVFNDAYSSIVLETNDLIHAFYSNIIDFIALDPTPPPDDPTNDSLADSPNSDSINIDSKVDRNLLEDVTKSINIDNTRMDALSKELNTFFADLFPIIYKNIIKYNRSSQFTTEYTTCLTSQIGAINPYNNINKLITKELVKNLKSMKILFNAIRFGVAKVTQINEVIDASLTQACVHSLTKMNYCHRCSDVDASGSPISKSVRPCTKYCVNVLNGCLAQDLNTLPQAWNSYLQSIMSIVQAIQFGQSHMNIEDVLYSLHSRISETIMFAMQEATNIDKKVRKIILCMFYIRLCMFYVRPSTLY